jgi:hypothetical protein
MTEAEWLACTDPQRMLAFLGRARRREAASDRQLRLFAAACVRHAAGQKEVGTWIGHTVLAEWFADGVGPAVPLNRGREVPIGAALLRESAWSAAKYVAHACVVVAYRESQDADALASELAAQAGLLRCVLGNPFRPVRMNPAWLAWNAGSLPELAAVAYDYRDLPSGLLDPTRLSVLADALEEAGCSDPDILDHCRQPGEHVRGCWVVDLILGKE